MKTYITHNKIKDGIEVKFSEEPHEVIKIQLGNLGYSYSKFRKLYWVKYNHALWNVTHNTLEDFLPEDEKKPLKKITIPEFDKGIFVPAYVQNRIDNKQFTLISVNLPSIKVSLKMVALIKSAYVARQLVLIFMERGYGKDWPKRYSINENIRAEIKVYTPGRNVTEVKNLLIGSPKHLVEYQIYLIRTSNFDSK